MNVTGAIVTTLLGLAIVLTLIPLIRRWRVFQAREFHQTHGQSVSRLGGLALALAFLGVEIVTMVFFPDHSAEKSHVRGVVVLGAMLMFGLGFWDDLRPIGAKRKLAAQILIAFLIYALGVGIGNASNPFTGESFGLGYYGGALVTVLWLVAMTNLINLIDGIDGLAGGISLMLMALLAYVGHKTGQFPLICCGVAGGLIGFLFYNFPPAKIHMGDGGAYFLGCLIGELTIVSSHKGTIVAALIAPLFVLALPILDVSLAIVRRGLKGLPLFRPDRNHIHHRLLGMGFSRRSAVLGMYCFTVFFLALGFAMYASAGRWLPVLAGVGVLVILLTAGRLDFAREWFAVGRVLGNSLNMRREVNYAMTVTRWLSLEGQRAKSMNEFWETLVFVSERLGFSQVTLQLEDGTREWRKPAEDRYTGFHHARFDFKAGGAGVLELRSRVCPCCQQGKLNGMSKTDSNEMCEMCERSFGRQGQCIGDGRVFAVISELFAESWHKASRGLGAKAGVAVRFSPLPDLEKRPSATTAPMPGQLLTQKTNAEA